MKARWHFVTAAAIAVASSLPAAAQMGGGGGMGGGGIGGTGSTGGIGGSGPIGGPAGRDSIGGIVRPGDMGYRGPGVSGGTSGNAGLSGSGTGIGGTGAGGTGVGGTGIGGTGVGGTGVGGTGTLGTGGLGASSAPLTGREPGGAPGSHGGNRSANTGYDPQRDLGINDPFAAAGTGIGGPSPTDMNIGSINEVLSQSPGTRPGLSNQPDVPGRAMSPEGGLDPLAGSMDSGIGGVGAPY